MADFYLAPGSLLEPGDVFLEIPFPSLKYPLVYFRASTKDPGTARVLTPETGPLKTGDSPSCKFEFKTAIFLSHGCEVESVERDHATERRSWLAAPVEPLSRCGLLTQKRTRDGIQPNKFYMPSGEYFGKEECFVDLRKITPVSCQYFLNGVRRCSLNPEAKIALQAHIGMFFSGFVLYVQSVPCPHCGQEVDPTEFRVFSGEEPDNG